MIKLYGKKVSNDVLLLIIAIIVVFSSLSIYATYQFLLKIMPDNNNSDTIEQASNPDDYEEKNIEPTIYLVEDE